MAAFNPPPPHTSPLLVHPKKDQGEHRGDYYGKDHDENKCVAQARLGHCSKRGSIIPSRGAARRNDTRV